MPRRPRPVEHFDEVHRLEPLLLMLCIRNAHLESTVQAWRTRFYVSQLRTTPAVSFIPEQRPVPDDEQLPATNRYQDLRLRRVDQ